MARSTPQTGARFLAASSNRSPRPRRLAEAPARYTTVPAKNHVIVQVMRQDELRLGTVQAKVSRRIQMPPEGSIIRRGTKPE
jgi:hypothetical protein